MTAQSLLECYIRAKDDNRPELIADCFAADAELTFEIETDAIDFPRRVTGASAIAQTLVIDFGKRFDRCRTYYLCAAPEADAHGVCTMPWLVAMRQKDNGALRLGKGTYRWRIEGERIAGLHIAIARMDVIDDPGSLRLHALQTGLSYPWLTRAELARHIAGFVATQTDADFALPFAQP